MKGPLRLKAGDVEAARALLLPILRPTPLLAFDEPRGRRALLKLENEQPTGSFKVRGDLSNLLRQPPSPAGFVTASAGNHGLGVAFAAEESGRKEPVTIFVPGSTPRTKVAKLERFPVEIRVAGQTYEDAERAAHAFEREQGAVFVHAYDDPWTAAGQGTMAVELHEALGVVGTIIIPVGGGGLISGSAAWLKERHPSTRVVAVQPEASPALSESIRRGAPLLEFPAGPTLADGLSGGIGRIVFEHRDLIDEVVNVPEAAIRAAIRGLHFEQEVRAEASGAITRAALSLPQSEPWREPIVCIITGGNIDDDVFKAVIAE